MRTTEELQEQLDDVKWQKERYGKALDEATDRRTKKALIDWLNVLDDRERAIFKHLQWIENCEHRSWEDMSDGARVCLDCGRIS
jgi:molecular chaperone GrpE (heat shock protein)